MNSVFTCLAGHMTGVISVCGVLLASGLASAGELHLWSADDGLKPVDRPAGVRHWVIYHSSASQNRQADGVTDAVIAAYHSSAAADPATAFVYVSCDADDAAMTAGLRENPVPFFIIPKSVKADSALAGFGEISELPAIVFAVEGESDETRVHNGPAAVMAAVVPPKEDTSKYLAGSLDSWLSDSKEDLTYLTNTFVWAWCLENGVGVGLDVADEAPVGGKLPDAVAAKLQRLNATLRRQENFTNLLRCTQHPESAAKNILALAGRTRGAKWKPEPGEVGPEEAYADEFTSRRFIAGVVERFEMFKQKQAVDSVKRIRTVILVELGDYEFEKKIFPCKVASGGQVFAEIKGNYQIRRIGNYPFRRPDTKVHAGEGIAVAIFDAVDDGERGMFERSVFWEDLRLDNRSLATLAIDPGMAELLIKTFEGGQRRYLLVKALGSLANFEIRFESGEVVSPILYPGTGRDNNPANPKVLGMPADLGRLELTWK